MVAISVPEVSAWLISTVPEPLPEPPLLSTNPNPDSPPVAYRLTAFPSLSATYRALLAESYLSHAVFSPSVKRTPIPEPSSMSPSLASPRDTSPPHSVMPECSSLAAVTAPSAIFAVCTAALASW